ncbi:MAG: hypothetical protein ACYC1L_06650 [Alphaproteobacteria bacterium]
MDAAAARPGYPWALAALALAGAVWIAFNLAYPNGFGGPDVFHFKDPGCNLALGYGFTSASYVGTDGFDAKFWFSQGPLFPLFYGAYASAFGCGLVADNAFNLATSLVLCALVLFLARPFLSGRWYAVFAVAIAILAPTGGYKWPTDDRPDHLALVFLLLVPVLAQMRPTARRAGFALAGLAFVTSPYYGLCALAIAAGLLIAGEDRWFTRRVLLGLVAGTLVFVAFPVAAVVAAMIADPDSIARFLTHTRRIFSDESIGAKLRQAVFSSGVNSILLTARWLFAVPILACLLLAARSAGKGRRAFVLPVLLFALCLVTPVFFLKQAAYYSAAAFVGLVLTWWCLGRAGLRAGRHPVLACAGLAVLILPLLPWLVTEPLRRIETIDSFRAEGRRAAAFAASLGTVPPGSVVLVPASHYFVYKKALVNIFNPEYLFPEFDPSRIEGNVVCRAGLRPGAFPPPDPVGRKPVAVDRPDAPALQLRLFGVTLMRNYADWSCDHVRY